MKYQITITGMHCTGCSNLIKMSLEDVALNNVLVDSTQNTATFESESSLSEVLASLKTAFADLKEYSFSELKSF